MTTDLDIKQLREQLIEVYTEYLNNPLNQAVKEVAQSLYATYWQAEIILDEHMRKAVGCLIYIGLDLEPLPTKEEIKQLIADLKAENEQS